MENRFFSLLHLRYSTLLVSLVSSAFLLHIHVAGLSLRKTA